MRHLRGQGVKKLSTLFEGYSNRFRAPQKSVVKAFVEVVGDLYNITIKEEECVYTPSTQILTVKSRGPVKTELMFRKHEILTHLKGRLGERSAPRDLI